MPLGDLILVAQRAQVARGDPQRRYLGVEVSRNAGGLPFPFVPLLKSVLIVMPLAVALQGISLLLRSIQDLKGS